MKNLYLTVLAGLGLFVHTNPMYAQKHLKSASSNIVGGTTTSIDQQPWQVYVSASGNVCGGSIIGPTTILTAAHCVYGKPLNQIYVTYGATNVPDNSNQSALVSQVVNHPSYNDSNKSNDIAVIELSSPLAFNQNVQPIRYDGGPNVDGPGSSALTSGWGKSCADCSFSYQLQRVSLTTVDNSTLDEASYSSPVNASTVIAAGNGTYGPCQGDSGGPLWVNSGGQNYLIGITSLAPNSGCGTGATIFTRVSSFCQWILQQTMNGTGILGPALLCTSESYTRAVSNTNLSWSTSNTSVLSISSGGIATRQNNFNGYISITVTGSNNCGSASNSRTIYVGSPYLPTLTIQGVAPYGAVDVQSTSYPSGPISYNWYRDGSFLQTTYSFLATLNGGSCGQQHYMQVSASNSCGVSPLSYNEYYQFPCSSYVLYPNPAQDFVSIEFSNADYLPDQVDLYSDESTKPLLSIDIQKKYKDKALKNGKIIELQTNSFPRGTYYIKVRNSRNLDKPEETMRIVLQ